MAWVEPVTGRTAGTLTARVKGVESMPDLKRINEMEDCLNECGEAVRSLRERLDGLNALSEKAVKLYTYYGSGDWYEDREGELPEGFRAGVLSEDAVYDSPPPVML